MQLPKRVPWASLSELEELCSWIYSDETDINAKQLAVNKVIHPLSYPPISPELTYALLNFLVIGVEIDNSTVTRPRIHIRTFDRDAARRFSATTPLVGRGFWV